MALCTTQIHIYTFWSRNDHILRHCCRKMNKSDQTMSEHRNNILDIVITMYCCCFFRHFISLSDDKMFEVSECSGANISEYSKYFPKIFRGRLRRQRGFIETLEGWVRAYVFRGYLKKCAMFFLRKCDVWFSTIFYGSDNVSNKGVEFVPKIFREYWNEIH